MENKERKIKKNIFKLEDELEKRKKLPNEIKLKIRKTFIINFSIIVFLVIFFMLLSILEENMQTNNYILILKVLVIILSCITIIMLEISYKTNKNSIILSSLEMIILTFFTMFLISAYSLYYGQFYKVITDAIIVSVIYYCIKGTINIIKIRKNYYKSLNDIKTIVAKR